MKIEVYADEQLVYDNNLEDLALLGLEVENNIEKAGVAELVMPPGHPSDNSFVAYRSVVEVYRNDVLLFRGRSLHPTDDFYNRRTITCEGERGFLQDGIMRPYLYQDGPAAIFADVIGLYNAQVEAFKQFVVGEINVTDPNNYIRLESDKAEQIADTIDKLVERVGGYIVFTTNESGQRVINWLAELPYRSNQVIEFGENLLDYARSDMNDELATVIVPYGAKVETVVETVDPETGETLTETTSEHVTIESVNDGLDFIQDYDAVALRGVISRPVYWDDVTEPANLLAKAQQYLAEHKLVITALELSAVDLSVLDSNIDTFQEGDQVRVRSKPHGVDEDFQLQVRHYNLLDPAADTVTLGKEQKTLSGADAAGDKKSVSELQQVKRDIRAESQLNVAAAVESVELALLSLISQTETAIRTEVSETYMTNDELESYVGTKMTQLSDSFTFTFETLEKTVSDLDGYTREQFEETRKYIRFVDGDIVIGEEGNALVLRLENDRIQFLDDGVPVAYITDKQLYITDAHFLHSLQLGSFAFLPRENGNLSLVKVG